MPLIIAHRGASVEFPENTLAAFERAVALGVDAIELDVHVTRDGVPVVFHDIDLRRTTGTRGRITASSWPDLESLRILQSEHGIPRLRDVLAFTRGKTVVQIELKGGAPVRPVLQAVTAARAAEWVVFASFSAATVAEAAEVAPAIPRMLISEARVAPPSLVRQLATCRANGISVNHRAVGNAAFVRYFQARGYGVWTWTVNDLPRARELAGWGVDGVMGDNPALLRRLL
jgi:glycerophosphoryl diester phosphodiesterase